MSPAACRLARSCPESFRSKADPSDLTFPQPPSHRRTLAGSAGQAAQVFYAAPVQSFSPLPEKIAAFARAASPPAREPAPAAPSTLTAPLLAAGAPELTQSSADALLA